MNASITPIITAEQVIGKIKFYEDNHEHDLAENLKKKYKELLSQHCPLNTQKFLDTFITRDEDMINLKVKIMKLARENDTVLLEGPSGTGKEILARALHGDRVGKFVDVNCAGLPEHLIESELFGHVRGAFTGADTNTAGLFKIASENNGTIFLDEVGELPLGTQAKLLRVLQENMIRKVGGKENEKISCRIVCATHKDLEKMVTDGDFRDDLFYRITTFHLKLLPLADRTHDIPHILEYIASNYEKEKKLPDDKKFPRAYPIPLTAIKGNVRSLQHIVRRYHVLQELPKDY